jgi:hypothetical protein
MNQRHSKSSRTRGGHQPPEPEPHRLEIAGPHGPAGSELKPITITCADWGPEEKQLAAAVRDGLPVPSAETRGRVLRALQRHAKPGADWHYPGSVARGLLAPEAQPALEQLVEQGLAEHAVRASGWRCLVYRLVLAPDGHAEGSQ